jgi:hypothetical protein
MPTSYTTSWDLTLSAIEQEQVRVPLLVTRPLVGEGDSAAAEQIAKPPRAAQNYRRNLASLLVATS